MALNIRNPEAEKLATEVAKLAGETKTEAVIRALRARLKELRGTRGPSLADELDAIAKRCAALPVLDARPAEAVLGYRDDGLPD